MKCPRCEGFLKDISGINICCECKKAYVFKGSEKYKQIVDCIKNTDEKLKENRDFLYEYEKKNGSDNEFAIKARAYQTERELVKKLLLQYEDYLKLNNDTDMCFPNSCCFQKSLYNMLTASAYLIEKLNEKDM